MLQQLFCDDRNVGTTQFLKFFAIEYYKLPGNLLNSLFDEVLFICIFFLNILASNCTFKFSVIEHSLRDFLRKPMTLPELRQKFEGIIPGHLLFYCIARSLKKIQPVLRNDKGEVYFYIESG